MPPYDWPTPIRNCARSFVGTNNSDVLLMKSSTSGGANMGARIGTSARDDRHCVVSMHGLNDIEGGNRSQCIVTSWSTERCLVFVTIAMRCRLWSSCWSRGACTCRGRSTWCAWHAWSAWSYPSLNPRKGAFGRTSPTTIQCFLLNQKQVLHSLLILILWKKTKIFPDFNSIYVLYLHLYELSSPVFSLFTKHILHFVH